MSHSPTRTFAMLRASAGAQWACVLALSTVFVAAMEAMHLPAALLLGPMIAGLLVAAGGGTIRMGDTGFLIAQGIVGCMIAHAMPLSVLSGALRQWPVFVLGVGSTVFFAALMGWLLTRRRVLPGTTAIWGSAPGAASAMTVMAGEFGADMPLVGFMLYLRVLCVAGIASVVASIAGRGHPLAAMVWLPPVDWAAFAGTAAIAATGFATVKLFKLRAGGLIVPLVLTGVVMNAGWMTIELPPWFLAVGYALLGWTIGLRFTRQMLGSAARALPVLVGAILTLIAAGAGFGLVLTKIAGIDPLTAYLATSPGGADSVAIIAASSKVDAPFVMSMQMARFAAVLATGPALARFLAGRAGTR